MRAVLFLLVSAAGVRVTVSKEEAHSVAESEECTSQESLVPPGDGGAARDHFSDREIERLEALPMPPAYIPDESHGRTFEGIESTYGILPPTPEQIGSDDVMEECTAECSPYEEAQDCWGHCAKECTVKWLSRSGSWERALRYDCCMVTTCAVVNNFRNAVVSPLVQGVQEWEHSINGRPQPAEVPMGLPVNGANAASQGAASQQADGPLSGLTNLIQRPWRRVSDTDLEATRAPAGAEQREAFQAVYDERWEDTENAASTAVQAMQKYPALVTEDVVADTLAVKWAREVEERLVSQQAAVTFKGDKMRPQSTSQKAVYLKVPRSYTGAIFGGKEAQRIRGLEWVKPLDLVMMETSARLEYGVSKGGYIDGEMLFKAGILLGKFQEKEFEGKKYQLPTVKPKKAKGTKLSLTTVIVPSYESFGEQDLYELRKVSERLFTKLGRRLGQWQVSRHFRSRQAWDEAAYQLYRVALRCSESQSNRDVAAEKLYAVPAAAAQK
jgi:hypothetical protein